MSKQSEILLQSGTNEIEIFEFLMGTQCFGLNALKIKHVAQFQPEQVHPLPMMPAGMLGAIVERNEVIKIVDLRKVLNIQPKPNSKREILILAEFNRQVLGFVVDEILGIQRVGWENVQSPNSILNTNSITGIAIVGDREISMLDLESIILSIFGISEDINQEKPIGFPAGFKILVADDSLMIRKKIKWFLEKIEARDVEIFENGALLYNRFADLKASGVKVGLVMTDLEMPQVDGFACCKKIKSLDKNVPVLIFSSLINEQISRKCSEVGAELSLNKEEFSKLGQIIKGFFPEFEKRAA